MSTAPSELAPTSLTPTTLPPNNDARADTSIGALPDETAQLRAEATLVRRALIGMGIGVVVCVAVWMGIVFLATVGNGNRMLPMLGVAAACGVLAGIFLGGSAGALAGALALEQVEHERMHAISHAADAGTTDARTPHPPAAE